MAPKTEVFFIVDGRRLEVQACLLAPSLRANLNAHQHAVAYIRQDYRAELHDFTADVLQRSGVELREIPDTDSGDAPWAAPYPEGNKILAAAAPRDCDVSVFLDTDTVLMTPVDWAAHLGEAEMAACVSDYGSPNIGEAEWTTFYETFGLPLPEDRVRLNAGRRLLWPPYYNAGMVVLREAGLGLGRQWLEAALRFEAEVQIPYSRTNIDQFTLPILGYMRDAPVKALDQHMNFNVQSFGAATDRDQTLIHYHNVGVLWICPPQARFALECLMAVAGPDAPQRLVEIFGAKLLRRARFKTYLADLAAERATS
ncbi:hypothetical protein V8J82_18115 [Gymnodinialimonas sp. 2305UL16-5]|uniref:hypothetical protein n=1 Tax=Gymnodinialimonas mytili TaxID=3126503 RepID=UPI0030986238